MIKLDNRPMTSLLIPMYDNMTTYMLSDSPESGSGSNHQIGGGSSSNAPSLIGSPRSTPVFGNGHALKVWKWDNCTTYWNNILNKKKRFPSMGKNRNWCRLFVFDFSNFSRPTGWWWTEQPAVRIWLHCGTDNITVTRWWVRIETTRINRCVRIIRLHWPYPPELLLDRDRIIRFHPKAQAVTDGIPVTVRTGKHLAFFVFQDRKSISQNNDSD